MGELAKYVVIQGNFFLISTSVTLKGTSACRFDGYSTSTSCTEIWMRHILTTRWSNESSYQALSFLVEVIGKLAIPFLHRVMLKLYGEAVGTFEVISLRLFLFYRM